MKSSIAIALLALVFSACTIETVEPRYDPRDRIVGHYEAEEYSETYHDITHYTLYISKSGYDREIYLNNFYAADLSVRAKLMHDKITIPYQVVDGFEIEGTGTVYRHELKIFYSVRDRYSHAYTDFCETTAWFDY